MTLVQAAKELSRNVEWYVHFGAACVGRHMRFTNAIRIRAVSIEYQLSSKASLRVCDCEG